MAGLAASTPEPESPSPTPTPTPTPTSEPDSMLMLTLDASMTLTMSLSLSLSLTPTPTPTLTLAPTLSQGTSGAWVPVRGTFVTKGTHPPGSMWAMIPLPTGALGPRCIPGTNDTAATPHACQPWEKGFAEGPCAPCPGTTGSDCSRCDNFWHGQTSFPPPCDGCDGVAAFLIRYATPWFAAPHAATHRYRGTTACSGRPPGPERSAPASAALDAEGRLRRRSGACPKPPIPPPSDDLGSDHERAIRDVVKIPAGLKPGPYVLGWRWDCEATAQVWSSCADVELVA